MAFTTITIVGTFQRADGTASTGTITATLNQPIVNTNITVDTEPIVASLNQSGQIVNAENEPLTLVATDDTGTEPAGSFYTITAELDDAPTVSRNTPVPSASPGGTFNIAPLFEEIA